MFLATFLFVVPLASPWWSTVLRSEISMPGVYAPQHKDVVAGKAVANLPSSGGFEGMAINKSGTRLYTLLERTVTGDTAGTLRIDEFDIGSEKYTGRRFIYPLDAIKACGGLVIDTGAGAGKARTQWIDDHLKDAGVRLDASARKLIEERLFTGTPPEAIGRFGPNWDVCPEDCCPPPQRRPTTG